MKSTICKYCDGLLRNIGSIQCAALHEEYQRKQTNNYSCCIWCRGDIPKGQVDSLYCSPICHREASGLK
jgi:hypothetical protein